MKKIAVTVGMIALMGGFAFAADDSGATSAAGAKKGTGPCLQVVQACKGAGFIKNDAKDGKGLFKNCVGPLMKGQSVQGVTVDSGTVQACKDARAKRRANRKAAKGAPPANPPSGSSGSDSSQK